MTARARARVEGVVQGVGFRPFVFRLATELGLGGWVNNDERGVVVEVEGAAAALGAFRERLEDEAPPLAVVERVAWRSVPARGERTFRIAASGRRGEADAAVAADAATCDACLHELFDPAGEAELRRQAEDEGAEADALDDALHARAGARGHDVTARTSAW